MLVRQGIVECLVAFARKRIYYLILNFFVLLCSLLPHLHRLYEYYLLYEPYDYDGELELGEWVRGAVAPATKRTYLGLEAEAARRSSARVGRGARRYINHVYIIRHEPLCVCVAAAGCSGCVHACMCMRERAPLVAKPLLLLHPCRTSAPQRIVCAAPMPHHPSRTQAVPHPVPLSARSTLPRHGCLSPRLVLDLPVVLVVLPPREAHHLHVLLQLGGPACDESAGKESTGKERGRASRGAMRQPSAVS
eukprot:scaffold17701_cov113-Isochrysis_galbana.AAC.1